MAPDRTFFFRSWNRPESARAEAILIDGVESLKTFETIGPTDIMQRLV